MGFFAPWFLAGILAIGLPLWLHLLRQYKRRPLPFSSLLFFEKRVQSSVKHRRLRYLALLSLRLSLLILLAIAFAQPFVYRRSETAGRRTLHIIAVDDSFSMRAAGHLSDAKRQAQQAVNALPGGALAQVLAVDSRVETLTAPSFDKSALRAAVSAIQPTDRASSFGELSRVLRYVAQTGAMRLEVDFFSDMQQTSMPADFHQLQAGPSVALHLHCVGSEGANWAIANVNVPAEIDHAEDARITANVAGWGTPATTRTAILTIDGKAVAQKEIAIPPNGRAAIEFTGFDVRYGWHQGEIRIEPSDGLPQDDQFIFAIQHAETRKALLLYAARDRSGILYYQTALEAGTHGNVRVEAAPVENISERDFSRFAFIVLSDPGELDPALADALCSYVQKGGAVLIALGPNTSASGRIPLSKEQFSEQHLRQSAGYVDNAHFALSSVGHFENVQFSETASFTPKKDARILARFSDDTPLLVEERAGEGRKLIFASTLDNSTSDFVLHPSFVPFVVQTARYLARIEDRQPSVLVDAPVSLRQRAREGSAAVSGPDGKQLLSLAEASRAMSFNPDRAGFYEISKADGEHLLIAANADRRESDLRPASAETLALWRNTGDTSGRNDAPAVQVVERPWSFWRWLLIAALLAALLEAFVSGRYLTEERQTL